MNRPFDCVGIVGHDVLYFAEHRAVRLVDVLVHLGDYAGSFGVLIHEGLETLVDHLLNFVHHGRQVNRRFDRIVLGKKARAEGNVRGLIAHSFELVINLEYRDNKTQVTRHRLVQGEDLQAILLDLDFGVVDLVVGVENFVGQVGTPVDQCRNRLVNRVLDFTT